MIEYCAQWLLDYLRKSGRANVKRIREEAERMGWKKKDLKEARKEIGVKTIHDQARDEWYWYI